MTAAAVAAVLALTACGESDVPEQPAATSDEPEVSSIKIGATQIAPYAPLHVADQRGFFKDEGLDVSIEIGSGGAEQLPLAVQGTLQVIVTPLDTAINAKAQGLDIVLMPKPTYQAKEEEPGQTATLVREDSDIKSLGDLQGKKVAINVIGSLNWLYNRAMLDEAGVDLEKVTYVEVPFPNMLDALKNGSVDAIVEVQPFVYLGETVGGARVLAYDFLEVEPGVKLTAYGASRQWADENPNAMAAVQRALVRAVEYLQENPDKAPAMIAGFTGAETELIEGAGLPEWSTEDLTESELTGVMSLMREHEVLEQPLDDIGELLWTPRPG